MLIIPAIDIYDNTIVRLQKGDFNNITYYKNSPVQQAELYESMGFDLIHMVDLQGSRSGKFTALESLKKIKTDTKLRVEFGGGIRDVKTAKEVFDSGADFAIIGSLSVKNKEEFELIVKNHTPQKVITAIDSDKEMIKVSGWTEDTSLSIYSHIEYCMGLGVTKFLCTDISKDGMLTGVNIPLYKKIMNKYPHLELLASGGVKDIEDIKELKSLDPYGVVVGRAIYEGKIDLKELAEIAV